MTIVKSYQPILGPSNLSRPLKSQENWSTPWWPPCRPSLCPPCCPPWNWDHLWPYLSHTNPSQVNVTCLGPFKAKIKFVWWVGGGWVKTKNRVMLRSKSLSFELSELDFAWLWPSWPSPDLHPSPFTWTGLGLELDKIYIKHLKNNKNNIHIYL